MGLLYLLNKKESELALIEAKASVRKEFWTSTTQEDDGAAYFPDVRGSKIRDSTLISHLGLTHRIIRVLATCAPGNIKTTLSALPMTRHLKGKTYRVCLTKMGDNVQFTEGELANIIWHAQKEPRVDLDHPGAIVDIVIASAHAYIGLRVWENTDDFQARRAHLLPSSHPSATHPAIARALVNIAGGKRVHDPFCGSGGFLIEGGLAGKRMSGADIEHDMIVRARQNCAAFKIKPELRVADATMWLPRCQGLVADLPYGKSTRPVALNNLVEAFLYRAAQSTSRVVLGAPHELRFPKDWVVRAHATSYVHKSMTKHFYVLEKRIRRGE